MKASCFSLLYLLFLELGIVQRNWMLQQYRWEKKLRRKTTNVAVYATREPCPVKTGGAFLHSKANPINKAKQPHLDPMPLLRLHTYSTDTFTAGGQSRPYIPPRPLHSMVLNPVQVLTLQKQLCVTTPQKNRCEIRTATNMP